jgi:membrane-associated phospholipid phosphatase
MTGKRLVIGGLRLRATDGIILAALAFFSLLAVIACARVSDWWLLVLKNLGVGLAYLLFNWCSDQATKRFAKFSLRVVAVTLAYAYLFGAVDPLQLILHGRWMDEEVLAAERWIFGVQPTLWLEGWVSRPLTEWMMFCYVIYLPLYPALCGIIYYRRGELAMEDYLFTLGFTNILCDLGFILFPVAGPMYHIRQLYTVPLEGWVWTFLGEGMRKYLQFAGGSIPSPHAAAATIMWLMAYRYHRRSFWVLAPVIVTLYVSTFYCRYHYLSDAVVGIVVAGLALAIAPRLMKAWDRVADRNAHAERSPAQSGG